MAYRFIQKYSYLFGVRWLLRWLNIFPNAYYNYLKNRKKESIQEKEDIKNKIKKIYHSNNGILGHRQIKKILQRLYNINISKTTVHKYLNKELKLFSIVRPKKPNKKKGSLIKFLKIYWSKIFMLKNLIKFGVQILHI